MNHHRPGELAAALIGIPQIAHALAQLAARVGETTITLDHVGLCVEGSDETRAVWTALRGQVVADQRAWSSIAHRPMRVSALGVTLI